MKGGLLVGEWKTKWLVLAASCRSSKRERTKSRSEIGSSIIQEGKKSIVSVVVARYASKDQSGLEILL